VSTLVLSLSQRHFFDRQTISFLSRARTRHNGAAPFRLVRLGEVVHGAPKVVEAAAMVPALVT
jgi:hypothetical protein